MVKAQKPLLGVANGGGGRQHVGAGLGILAVSVTATLVPNTAVLMLMNRNCTNHFPSVE